MFLCDLKFLNLRIFHALFSQIIEVWIFFVLYFNLLYKSGTNVQKQVTKII